MKVEIDSEVLDSFLEDMKYLASQAKYQPCKTCLYNGEYSTIYSCKRTDSLGKEEPCPNFSFPYYEWKYKDKIKKENV